MNPIASPGAATKTQSTRPVRSACVFTIMIISSYKPDQVHRRYLVLVVENLLSFFRHFFFLFSSGWSQLEIESNAAFDDQTQAFAAGWLEARLTAPRIYQAYNVFAPPGTASNFTVQFIEQNVLWTRQQLISRAISTFAVDNLFDNFDDLVPEHQIVPCKGLSPVKASSGPAPSADQGYWLAVATMYAQLRGMYEGYVSSQPPAGQAVTWINLLLISYSIELDDVQMAPPFNHTFPTSSFAAASSPAALVRSESRQRIGGRANVGSSAASTYTGAGHCSTLIKLAANATDIFVGHTTWFTYSTMIRIFKFVVTHLFVYSLKKWH